MPEPEQRPEGRNEEEGDTDGGPDAELDQPRKADGAVRGQRRGGGEAAPRALMLPGRSPPPATAAAFLQSHVVVLLCSAPCRVIAHPPDRPSKFDVNAEEGGVGKTSSIAVRGSRCGGMEVTQAGQGVCDGSDDDGSRVLMQAWT